MKMKNLIWIGMIFVVLSFAYADFGQSAGVLDFGNMTIKENKTLTYFLINTGETPLEFTITHPDNIVVSPEYGIIEPKSQKTINVSAFAEKIGEFSGKITATAKNDEKGTIVIQVAVEKNYKYNVIEEQKELDATLLILSISLAMFLIFFVLYIINRKGGKKRWKFGK